MNEIWKDIKNYKGKYQVSNFGRVKSLIENEKILKPEIRSGYYSVNLIKNNKRLHKRIHRLVAEAFIPNPSNLPQVNHKDENKLNNNITNLEWCNNRYNATYSMGKKIKCIETGVIYNSVRDASRDTKIPLVTISYNLTGKLKTARGYHFVCV